MKPSWLECFLGVVILCVLVILLLPALSKTRESARRVSCQNNLKQMGFVFKMFANESRGGVLPPLSPVYGNWMMDMNAICPEYLADLNLLVCPSSVLDTAYDFRLRTTANHPGQRVGDMHPDCVSGKYYTYTGFMLTGDEPALALYTAYHIDSAHVRQAANLDLPVPRWANSRWHPSMGGVPVLWERIPQELAHMPHDGPLINVLTMDGAVQAVKYSPLNQSENFPVTELVTWTFGADVPRLDSDCY